MERKVLILCACGRSKGFTYAMCAEAEDVLVNSGLNVETVYPINMEISHCTGCGSCKNGNGCIIEDDMNRIYALFQNADLVILCTPIHYSGPSSVIKSVIDRFQTLWYCSTPGPKYMAAMMCGGDDEPDFRGSMHVFKALAATARSKWIGELKISGTDHKQPADIKKDCKEFVISLIITVNENSESK